MKAQSKCSDCEFISTVAGLEALAAAICSFDFSLTVLRHARIRCGDAMLYLATGTCNFLSGVALIGARVVVGCFFVVVSRSHTFCSVI